MKNPTSQPNENIFAELVGEVTGSLYWFSKIILDTKPIVPHAHMQLCEFVNDRYIEGEDKEIKPFKLILMPRGSLKTTIVTINHSIQQIVLNPDIRILIASETYANAKDYVKQIKGTIETNENINNLYGNLVNDKSWRDEWFVVATRKRVQKEPTVSAAGIDQTKVGMHYDLIIFDDVVSQNNIQTKEQMQKVQNFYSLALSLLEPTGKMLVVGTRWAYYDLYNHIIENERHKFNVYKRSAVNDDGSLFYPERLSAQFLADMKVSQGSFFFSCNPKEAPVLMGDMTLKPIKDVKTGDEVIGWYTKPDTGRRKLIKTKVVANGSRIAQVQKVHLESGNIIRCTPDHKWYTKYSANDQTHKEYIEAKVGRPLMQVFDIRKMKLPKEKEKTAHWLGGIFDGEGSCTKKHSSIFLHQSEKENPDVTLAIENALKELNYDYGVVLDERKDSKSFYIRGGKEERIRFIQQCSPVRSNIIVDQVLANSAQFVKQQDRVTKIELQGREKVYSLQTETGNYIVWGYASKNCQYLNEALNDENAVIKKDWIKYYNKDDLPPLEKMNVYVTCDPAISKTGDYTGIVVCGVDERNNVYVLYAQHFRLTDIEIINKVLDVAKHYNAIKIGIETQVFQIILKTKLYEAMKGRKEYYSIVELQTPAQQKKEFRILGLAPKFEAGEIYIDKQMTDLEDELIRFSLNTRQKHDDLIDALSHQLKLWHRFSFIEKLKEPKGSFKWLMNKMKKTDNSLDYIGNQKINTGAFNGN